MFVAISAKWRRLRAERSVTSLSCAVGAQAEAGRQRMALHFGK